MRFHLRTSLRLGVCLAIVAAILALTQPVAAAIMPVSSRADLGANELVDWSVLGRFPSNPFSITSTGGLGVRVEVGNNPGAPNSFDIISHFVNSAGGPPGPADFPVGTDYISAPNTNVHFPLLESLILTYDQPVRGVGADFAARIFIPGFGGPTLPPGVVGSVNLSAFDSAGHLLGSTAFDVTSVLNNNGIPQFLGLLSDSANIKDVRVDVFAVSIIGGEGQPVFGYLDGVSLVTPAPAATVPEPASLTLLGLGLLGLAGYGWRRRASIA